MTDTSVSALEGHVLVRAVGRGESSVVWEARRLATGAAVAVKVLDADVPAADAVRFLAGERAAMSALARHPNVVTVLDAGVQDERPWLAMELCRRGSLAAHVDESGPLDVPTALRVLARLADALAVAHDAGVLHGNVKPSNVLLTDAGEPALGDFGIGAGATPRSDVRALGSTVEELLAGAPADQARDDLLSLVAAMRAADGAGPASMTEVAAAVGALARDHGITLAEPAFPPLLPEVAEPAASPSTTSSDGWSMPLPAEQVLTFDPQSAAARTPFSADPDGAPLFTTPAPFRPRDEDEPESPRRVPLVAAAVLAVLVTAGAVFGISQSRNAAPAPPLSAVSPAALAPTTTTSPETTTTTAPATTSAEPTTTTRATVTTRPRATRAPATRTRATATTTRKSDSSDSDTKKKKKKKDD